MSQLGRVRVDSGHDNTYSALSVFWPESEFNTLIARWPQLAAHLGATWDEHRRRVEMMAEAVEVPDDASAQDKMLAYTGRRP